MIPYPHEPIKHKIGDRYEGFLYSFKIFHMIKSDFSDSVSLSGECSCYGGCNVCEASDHVCKPTWNAGSIISGFNVDGV